MIRIRRRKHIIRNIAPHVIHIVLPFQCRRHALHLANNLALGKNLASIRIALDVILRASPRPLRAPFDARPGRAVVVCALRAGSCGVFAPQVVENFVAVGGVVGVLGTERDRLLDLADFTGGWSASFRGGDGWNGRVSENDEG
jgi:hypothetical protein